MLRETRDRARGGRPVPAGRRPTGARSAAPLVRPPTDAGQQGARWPTASPIDLGVVARPQLRFPALAYWSFTVTERGDFQYLAEHVHVAPARPRAGGSGDARRRPGRPGRRHRPGLAPSRSRPGRCRWWPRPATSDSTTAAGPANRRSAWYRGPAHARSGAPPADARRTAGRRWLTTPTSCAGSCRTVRRTSATRRRSRSVGCWRWPSRAWWPRSARWRRDGYARPRTPRSRQRRRRRLPRTGIRDLADRPDRLAPDD